MYLQHILMKTTADPGGGGGKGGPDPPGKSQVIWVSIGNKHWTSPMEKVGPPPTANCLYLHDNYISKLEFMNYLFAYLLVAWL